MATWINRDCRLWMVGAWVFGLAQVALADTILVPSQVASVGLAIELAHDGDQIFVDPGTYFVNALSTDGKAITIRGAVDAAGHPVTTLDAGGGTGVLIVSDGEGLATRFENLVFQNGSSFDGGGAYIEYASPTFVNCSFQSCNALRYGGAVYLFQSSATFTRCHFRNNWAGSIGGAIFAPLGMGPAFIDCVVCGCDAPEASQAFIAVDEDDVPPDICFASRCDDSNLNGLPDECEPFWNTTVRVPQDVPTIPLAIDIVANGGTVVVGSGLHVVTSPLDLRGKRVTVRGAVHGDGAPDTTIDGAGVVRLLRIENGEGPESAIENIRFIRGFAADTGGGSLRMTNSSPTLRNCEVGDSSASNGGAAFIAYAAPRFERCTFRLNNAVYGGALFLLASHVVLDECHVRWNSAVEGGGIYVGVGSALLVSCSDICENYGPEGAQLLVHASAMFDAAQSCVADLCNVCDTDANGIPDTCQHAHGDVNLDGAVDGADLVIILGSWGFPPPAAGDADGDGDVDAEDLAAVLAHWGALR